MNCYSSNQPWRVHHVAVASITVTRLGFSRRFLSRLVCHGGQRPESRQRDYQKVWKGFRSLEGWRCPLNICFTREADVSGLSSLLISRGGTFRGCRAPRRSLPAAERGHLRSGKSKCYRGATGGPRELLRTSGPNVDLLHSRFSTADKEE